jgi:glucarate dehydratase
VDGLIMKIVKMDLTTVNVPFSAPLRHSGGVRHGLTRTIVRLTTDTGLEGWGETQGGAICRSLMKGFEKTLIGHDPFNIEPFLQRYLTWTPYFAGYAGMLAIAGVEMAMWDLMGKATKLPLYKLLGGKVRDTIPFSAYLFYRYPAADGRGEISNAKQMIDYCRELQRTYGFETFKFKGGVFEPAVEMEAMQQLREALGPNAPLRFDPNGVWTVETTLRWAGVLKQLKLEYLEDPTWGMEGNRRVRRELPIPLATNMYVVDFDSLATGVRCEAVDIVLADVHKWGGVLSTKKLAAVCQVMGLGISMHSGAELGISTLCHVHLAATMPHMKYAVDSHDHQQADDILATGRLKYEGGCIAVPDTPGIGAQVDLDKLQYFAKRNQEDGDYVAIGDSRRPDFIPQRSQF